MLDYDGVLTPIAATPELAVLSGPNRVLLESLAKSPRVRVAIVSGRALRDVREHVRIDSIIYAGNHGAEIDLNGAIESYIGLAGYRDDLIAVRDGLSGEFAGFQGARIEDKGFGIGLHYRELAPAQLDDFHERFSTWSKTLPEGLQVMRAKKMFEIRPKVAWNKGNAVWHIWQTLFPESVPICLGDDLTDEDGFLALQGKGINIFVGEERHSYAEYILASPAEVMTFLKRLLEEAVGRMK
jgi:trehalose-phosphatase